MCVHILFNLQRADLRKLQCLRKLSALVTSAMTSAGVLLLFVSLSLVRSVIICIPFVLPRADECCNGAASVDFITRSRWQCFFAGLQIFSSMIDELCLWTFHLRCNERDVDSKLLFASGIPITC